MTLGRLAFAISAMDVGRRTSATAFPSGSLRVIRRQSGPPQPVPGRGPAEGAACALSAARAKMDAARMTCAARRVGRIEGILLWAAMPQRPEGTRAVGCGQPLAG